MFYCRNGKDFIDAKKKMPEKQLKEMAKNYFGTTGVSHVSRPRARAICSLLDVDNKNETEFYLKQNTTTFFNKSRYERKLKRFMCESMAKMCVFMPWNEPRRADGLLSGRYCTFRRVHILSKDECRLGVGAEMKNRKFFFSSLQLIFMFLINRQKHRPIEIRSFHFVNVVIVLYCLTLHEYAM